MFNPAFDVTPNGLVTAIITEKGIIKGNYQEELVKTLSSLRMENLLRDRIEKSALTLWFM